MTVINAPLLTAELIRLNGGTDLDVEVACDFYDLFRTNDSQLLVQSLVTRDGYIEGLQVKPIRFDSITGDIWLRVSGTISNEY